MSMVKLVVLFLVTTINLNALRLVTVGGSITETCIALGCKDDLVGVDLSSVYPPKIVKKIPKVGYWLQLPKEGILSLKPDLVLASQSSKPKKFLKILPSYGIKIIFISDGHTIQSARDKITEVAKALGKAKKAKKILARIDKNINPLMEEIKSLKQRPKVLFILNMNGGSMMAAGQDTRAGSMIKLAGGINVIKQKQYRAISKESIFQMNPDVIIFSSGHTKNSLNKRAILETNASNSKIYSMDILLISGFTVRLDTALNKLACIIHGKKLSICRKNEK